MTDATPRKLSFIIVFLDGWTLGNKLRLVLMGVLHGCVHDMHAQCARNPGMYALRYAAV